MTRDLVVTSTGAIAQIELNRPPHNYFDTVLLQDLVDAFATLAADGTTRAVVLCSAGRSFCAGADFSGPVALHHPDTGRHIYEIATDLFEVELPIVVAAHGAVIGGGLGLAMVADERVAATGSRWTANFARLGFHPGFGLSASLPWTIGASAAARLLGTGAELTAEDALSMGLVSEVAGVADVRAAAHRRAQVWADAAPLAVRSIRRTMRADLIRAVRGVLPRERSEQERLARTADWAEGIAAARERRAPNFTGK